MPENKSYGSTGRVLQPKPKVIQNPPAATVAQAVANAKKHVNEARKR